MEEVIRFLGGKNTNLVNLKDLENLYEKYDYQNLVISSSSDEEIAKPKGKNLFEDRGIENPVKKQESDKLGNKPIENSSKNAGEVIGYETNENIVEHKIDRKLQEIQMPKKEPEVIPKVEPKEEVKKVTEVKPENLKKPEPIQKDVEIKPSPVKKVPEIPKLEIKKDIEPPKPEEIKKQEQEVSTIKLDEISDILQHISLQMQLNRQPKNKLMPALFGNSYDKNQKVTKQGIMEILSKSQLRLSDKPNFEKFCQFLIEPNQDKIPMSLKNSLSATITEVKHKVT